MVSSKFKIQNMLTKTAMTVLAVVFYQSINTNATTNDINFKCTNLDEFLYATPKSQCRSYYKCDQRQRINFECSSGSIFDFYKQKCVRSPGVCYEPVCTGRIDGTYQDTTHACRRSFNCRGGRLTTIDNCPRGYLHNGRTCEPQESVTCETAATTAIAYPYAGDRRCLGSTDGNHGVEDYDCRKYIVCKNDDVIDDKECFLGNRFHSQYQRCVPAKEVVCPSTHSNDVCRNYKDGFHSDPHSNDCKTYIKCSGGKLASKNSCNSQAVFNGNSCVPLPLYQCPALINHPNYDICKRKPDGFMTDPRKSCANYVRCNQEKTIESFKCPGLQYFDQNRNLCVYEKNDNQKSCQEPYPSNECSESSTGFYQDKTSSCQHYFYCYNGLRTNFKCSLGAVFNGENCVAESSYICPNSDPNSCDSKENGYYKDKSGGCRAYYYCSLGKKYTYLCAENEIFDGNKCIAKTQVCGKDLGECMGKSDGYHQDITSNCRNYHFCLSGGKITTLTCRASNIFNGDSCVSPDSYNCPVRDNTNCIMRKCQKDCKVDGFFADIESSCRNYHFCIGGKKTVLTCKDNYIFNGEICVPNDTHQCPKYCNLGLKCPNGF